jgi:hypothetical protein
MSAPVGEHVVQVDQDSRALVDAVSLFASTGLAAGDSVLLVGSPDRRARIESLLIQQGVDVEEQKRLDRLVILDSQQTLATFLVEGMPDWDRFNRLVGTVVSKLTYPSAKLRIWGEMVNDLWEQRRIQAGVRLEEMWNGLAQMYPFCLFCTYVMEPLTNSTVHRKMLEGVGQTHSVFLPADNYSSLEVAIDAALEEVLGASQAGMVRTLVRTDLQLPILPKAQATLLWLQKNIPLLSEKVIARSKALYLQNVSRS